MEGSKSARNKAFMEGRKKALNAGERLYASVTPKMRNLSLTHAFFCNSIPNDRILSPLTKRSRPSQRDR